MYTERGRGGPDPGLEPRERMIMRELRDLLVSLLCWVVLGGYYTLYIAYHTLPRDIV